MEYSIPSPSPAKLENTNSQLQHKSLAIIKIKQKSFLACLFLLLLATTLSAQHSVARQWNDLLLEAIRKDFARPTVHARNLFHSSVVMYDAWAAYEPTAKTYFLGDTIGGFVCPFTSLPEVADIEEAQNQAISYAAYRLLRYRFQNSPGASIIMPMLDAKMVELGYSIGFTGTVYEIFGARALGNYLAQQMILFGQQDGSNELGNYANTHYYPVNQPLAPVIAGSQNINNPNRWQPLTLSVFIDQSGNVIPGAAPPFLSPEWGDVIPFAMTDANKTTYTRNGNDYQVYHDPGAPPQINPFTGGDGTEYYQWNFSLVSIWSSHLDTSDHVMWDISPANIGNVQSYPTSLAELPSFYNLDEGGDYGTGYDLNPVTGQPYEPQMVPRGDYARVLAEFWADGPDSETPPGHWFTIMNYVHDHPLHVNRWQGQGPILNDLEWDVKSYLTLGGAVHDAAVTSWGIKGWYDYLRPISAIRYMADKGQSSDPNAPNYSIAGIPLKPGFIELVESGDSLAGDFNENVGKVKVYAWKGPDFIDNPDTDQAGVGWILAENWWPYQRPTFVTPPFAGYVSGHSTYSRAGAEVLTAITGDPYFPGGMGEFVTPANEFLVFEEGPSVDVVLQWATYRDASDQCSLSRIWGGIHPPCDDIPGRLAGEKIGKESFNFAQKYFDANGQPDVVALQASKDTIVDRDAGDANFKLSIVYERNMDTLLAPTVIFTSDDPSVNTLGISGDSSAWVNAYTYEAVYDVSNSSELLDNIEVRVSGAYDAQGVVQPLAVFDQPFVVNTLNPVVASAIVNKLIVNDADAGTPGFALDLQFDTDMDTTLRPVVSFPMNDVSATLSPNMTFSRWTGLRTYLSVFDVTDANETIANIDVRVDSAVSLIGNNQTPFDLVDLFLIDTENPTMAIALTQVLIADAQVGTGTFSIQLNFSEAMDASLVPNLVYPNDDPTQTIVFNSLLSGWQEDTLFLAVFDVVDVEETLNNISLAISNLRDTVGNLQVPLSVAEAFEIDTENPSALSLLASVDSLTTTDIGVATFNLSVTYDEAMDMTVAPVISFPVEDPLVISLVPNTANSGWENALTYRAYFDVNNAQLYMPDIDVRVGEAKDFAGNISLPFVEGNLFDIVITDTLVSTFNQPGNAENLLTVYPNPIKRGKELRIDAAMIIHNFTMELLTIQGQQVLMVNQPLVPQFQSLEFSTETLHPGLYLLRIRGDEGQWAAKVLVL